VHNEEGNGERTARATSSAIVLHAVGRRITATEERDKPTHRRIPLSGRRRIPALWTLSIDSALNSGTAKIE
jgi:hypothetical protein